MEAQPFRFMDLPAELRLMVYERLPCRIRHFKIGKENQPRPIFRSEEMFCVLRTVETSILRTSRVIFAESNSTIHMKIEHFILDTQLRMIECNDAWFTIRRILKAVTHEIRSLRELMRGDSFSVPSTLKSPAFLGRIPKELAQFIQQAARSFMYHESKLSNPVLSVVSFDYKPEGYIPRLKESRKLWLDVEIFVEIQFGGKISSDSINQKPDKDHPPMNLLHYTNGAWRSEPQISPEVWAQEWLEGWKAWPEDRLICQRI